MESAKILKWLSGQDQPGDQDLNDIRILKDEYPYWPVAQWLFARFVKKDEGRSAANYKTDPIQFARFFAPKSTVAIAEVEQHKVPELEIVDRGQLTVLKDDDSVSVKSKPEDTLQEEVTEQATREPVPNIQVDEELEKMPAQSPDAASETEEDSEMVPVNNSEGPAILEELSEYSSNIADRTHTEVSLEGAQDDILVLIHELPNSIPASEELQNLMPIVELKTAEANPEPEIKTEDQEDEKSLMVMMSFTDWLHYFKNKRKQEQEEEDGKRALRTAWQKEKLTAAIEEETEAIPEPIFKQAMESISADSGVISESLALVLAKQGKFDKAIEMYRKLSLRNPEKSTYFAGLIQELRLKQNG